MQVAQQRSTLLTPDAGWAVLSLVGYVLGMTGVFLLHYDPGMSLPTNHPYWFPGLTIAQISAVLLVAAGAWATTLATLAAPQPQPRKTTLRAIQFVAFLVFLVLLPIAFRFSYGNIWSLLPLLLPLETRGLLRGHSWLVAKRYLRFSPKAGSALFGSPAYGPQLPVTSSALRAEYEEKIRQAGAQEERNRLARDLHDSIKQQIFAIHTSAATAQVRLQGDGVGSGDERGALEAIDQIRIAARDAMTELEVMLDQLRAEPLEPVGLAEALKKLCETTGFRIGAPVECVLGDLPPAESMRPKTAETVLRIAQEALANVARHARASRVTVTLDASGDLLVLTIQDDGAGIDVEKMSRGMGIGNMRSRAAEIDAELSITRGADGKGTVVLLSVMLHRPSRLWVWPILFMGPPSLIGLSTLARRAVNQDQHPMLYGSIQWAVDISLFLMLIAMLVFVHKEMQKRRKMAKLGKRA